MSPRLSIFVGSLLALAGASPAQGLTAAPGYVSNIYTVSPPPAFVSLVEILPSGEVLTFDGSSLVTLDAGGTVSPPLFTPPAGSFGEVLRLEPGGTAVLLAVSPGYDLYRHDLVGGTTSIVANIPYLYDLDFDEAGQICASVGEMSFSTTTLERIDPVTFAPTVFATLQGASGPLAPLPGGDLVYGTNDLALASQSILRFPAAGITSALMGGGTLTEADATVLNDSRDGLTSFAVDSDLDLYFSENDFIGGSSRIGRIDTGGSGTTTLAAAPSGFFVGRLAFARPLDPFDPMTGPGAGRLGAVYSDFATANLITVIEPSGLAGRLFGDCDTNGVVAVTDVLEAMRHHVGLSMLTGQARAQCDVNGSGSVTLIDALVIAQFQVGIVPTLGY